MSTVKKSTLETSVVEELMSMKKPGKPSLFINLIGIFLETADEIASQIQKSIVTKNLRALADASHSLKSSSAHIGALHLSEICLELEKIGEGDGDISRLAELGPQFDMEYGLVKSELSSIKAAA